MLSQLAHLPLGVVRLTIHDALVLISVHSSPGAPGVAVEPTSQKDTFWFVRTASARADCRPAMTESPALRMRVLSSQVPRLGIAAAISSPRMDMATRSSTRLKPRCRMVGLASVSTTRSW